MTSKAMYGGISTKQTKNDRTLSLRYDDDTGSNSVHNNDKCRRASKSAKTRRESSTTHLRELSKSARPRDRRKADPENNEIIYDSKNGESERRKENLELKNTENYSRNGDCVVEDFDDTTEVETGQKTMKDGQKGNSAEVSKEGGEKSALVQDIDTVAAVNTNSEQKSKRIDNGMVIRNKKISGRSPKLVRRMGTVSPSRYHGIRPVTVGASVAGRGGAPRGKTLFSRSSHRDSSRSSTGPRTTQSRIERSGAPESPTSPRRGDRSSRGESLTSPGRGEGLVRRESENESNATHATFDTDFHHVDISADSGWDTDLEAEEDHDVFEGTLRAVYLESCKKAGVIPASYFLRHMEDTRLEMKHHGLGPQGIKPIAIALVSNTSVIKLNLTDNWLGREGGQRICDMLSENCYIADVDLSDNRLGIQFAQSFNEVLKHNASLTHINLTGNHLDDRAAVHIAEAILNSGSLVELNLSRNLFGEQAGVVLGPAISENSSLKHLDLSWNGIRRKGAKAVAEGIKTNVLLQSVNLSWNGFGTDGAKWLGEALKVNAVLEELDVANNRITTEGAVLLGKGISVNESLKVLKIGKNPMQSAGCFALCAALLKNPNSLIQQMDFTDIMVNDDFHDMFNKVKEQLPSLRVRHGGDSLPKKPRARVHPMVKLQNYIQKRNLRMIDFFNQFDKDGSMSVTREEFAQGIELFIKESGIKLTAEEVSMLLDELDRDGDGEINYSELVIGHQDFAEKERKAASAVPLMQQ